MVVPELVVTDMVVTKWSNKSCQVGVGLDRALVFLQRWTGINIFSKSLFDAVSDPVLTTLLILTLRYSFINE